MGLIRRRETVGRPPHNTDRQPGACGVRRTGLYSRASTSLQRGSPNPRAVSAHAGDDPSRRTVLGLTVLYKGSGRAPPSLPWHAFYRAGRAASRAQL